MSPCTLLSWREHFGSEVRLSSIKVDGQESGHIHFAQCCHPVQAIPSVCCWLRKGMIIHRDSCRRCWSPIPNSSWMQTEENMNRQNYRVELSPIGRQPRPVGINGAKRFPIPVRTSSQSETPSPKSQSGNKRGFCQDSNSYWKSREFGSVESDYSKSAWYSYIRKGVIRSWKQVKRVETIHKQATRLWNLSVQLLICSRYTAKPFNNLHRRFIFTCFGKKWSPSSPWR